MYGPKAGSREMPPSAGICNSKCKEIICGAVSGGLVVEKPYTVDRVRRLIMAVDGIVNKVLDG